MSIYQHRFWYDFTPDAEEEIEILLNTITGKVVTTLEKPALVLLSLLSPQTVYLRYMKRNNGSIKPDKDGNFKIENVPEGEWVVLRILQQKYENYRESIGIEPLYWNKNQTKDNVILVLPSSNISGTIKYGAKSSGEVYELPNAKLRLFLR